MENRKQDLPRQSSGIIGWFRTDLGSRYNLFLIPLSILVGLLCALKYPGPWVNPLATIVWMLVALFAVALGFSSADEGFKKTATVILIAIGAAAIFL